MNKAVKQRIAFALKCKVEEIPLDPQELGKALQERRAKLKKAKEMKHG